MRVPPRTEATLLLAVGPRSAPEAGRAVTFGSEVVRPAGVAATASAAPASSSARAATSGVPAISRMCLATSRRSSIGVDVPPVTPTMRAVPNTVGSVRSRTPSTWMAGVPAISHRRVSSLVLALDRPPTTTMRSTSLAASIVSCWRRIVTGQTVLTILSSWARLTMNAASFSNFQGGWVDWLMRAIRFLRGMAASHSSSSSTTMASGANPSMPTTSACLGVPRSTIV